MATENRFIRIEDWKGNVYFPETSSSESTAGSITDSSAASTDDPTADTYTQGVKVVDSAANGGSAIFLKSGSTEKILFRTLISGVNFGNVSLCTRLKSSDGTGDTQLIKVCIYYVDKSTETTSELLLDTQYIKAGDIGVANEYVTVGTVTNFKGAATGSVYLKVEFIVLPNTEASIYFDNVAVALALPSTVKSTIYIDGDTIIVP